jgi:hypothetical protein
MTAVSELQTTAPKLQVQFDRTTGSPAHISVLDGFLTGAQPQLVAADASGPTRAFLDANSALFGHGAEALDQAKIKREFVTAHNGLRTVIWEQQVDVDALCCGSVAGRRGDAGELEFEHHCCARTLRRGTSALRHWHRCCAPEESLQFMMMYPEDQW